MNLKDKQELVRLLNLYCADLVAENNRNNDIKNSDKVWKYGYKFGVKAQYDHARIIAEKMSREVGAELKTYGELMG